MGREERRDRCPLCGKEARREKIRQYHYVESGLDNVYLLNSVLRFQCPIDGELIRIPSEQQLLQVVALVLLEKPGLLAAKELRFLRLACDLTQARMARLLELRGHATVAERESGKSRITNEADFFFRAKLTRELWAWHIQHPNRSFLAPIHVSRLKDHLERFTDLVDLRKGKRQPDLELEHEKETWLERAA